MVMVAVRAKGALWRANASLFVSLAVSVVNRGPTTVDVTLNFRGNANGTPPKSLHHQCSELWTHPLFQSMARLLENSSKVVHCYHAYYF